MSARLGDYLRLVKFSHSVFALPFALMAAWIAADGLPAARTIAGVVVCAVAARTAAMAFNRLVDRRIDADNPRTARREIPAGVISAPAAMALIVASSAIFIAGAAYLNPLCGWLSPVVLLWLLGYSFAKRFTWLAHIWLGAALGLAPLGAWLAVRGDFSGSQAPALLLALAVTLWVAGFDLIYATQDAGFDRDRGLASIPARFGIATALRTSAVFHVATVALLAAVGWSADLSWVYGTGVLGATALLVLRASLGAPRRSVEGRRRVLHAERLGRDRSVRLGRTRSGLGVSRGTGSHRRFVRTPVEPPG